MTVVVIGDVLLDAIVERFQAISNGSDTPARIRWRQGGAAANTARWLARAGQRCRIIGKVGDDAAGVMLRLCLDADGVDVRFMAIDRTQPTGSVMAVVADGDRDMLTDRGASATLRPSDFPAGWLDDATHVHVSGYVLLHGESRNAGLEAIAAAVAAGVTVSVDPASSSPIQRVGPDALLRWLDGATTVLPNSAEAMLLSGEETPRTAATWLARRIGEAVVTDGARGAVWSDGTHSVRTAASVLDGPINPVGAGDAFTAGWLAARVIGHADPRSALTAATALAAKAVSASG